MSETGHAAVATYDQLFPGRFIKAGEMDGREVTLTIRDVYLDTIEQEDGREKAQAVVAFEETAREWALNKTNGQCLRAMWGDRVDDWIGKRVTIFPERDASGLADSGVCIRVKGSPDISKPIRATIKLPRRRPVERTLVPTGNGKRAAKAAPSEPQIEEPDFIREQDPQALPEVDENGEIVEPTGKPVTEWQRTRLRRLGWSDAAMAQMDYATAKGYIDAEQGPASVDDQGGLL